MTKIRRHFPFLFLLSAYIVLAIMYTSVVPPMESPDGYYHFALIEHTDRTGSPPRPATVEEARAAPYEHLAYHAPLYYRVSGFIIRPIGAGDFIDVFRRNPHAQIGEPGARDNQNFIAHVEPRLQGSGLAVQVIRLWSMVLGAITVCGIYALSHAAFPRRRDVALLTVAVVVFNPQFIFISSVINNDNLVIALSTLIVALTIYCVRYGLTWPRLLGLAVLLALNAISKASGLVLYPVVGVACLYICWRDRVALLRIALYALAGLTAFALIAGWWYLDNWTRYGDFTASSWVARATGLRSDTIDWVSELWGAYLSFWGLFGWFNVSSPDIFYGWTLVLIAVAVAGVLWSWRARRDSPSRDDLFIVGLMIFYAILFFFSWVSFNVQVQAAQGRLFFPLIGLVACFIGFGLARWRRAGRLMLLPMMLACVALPVFVIYPTYAPTASVPAVEWDAPENAVPVLIREPWADEVCLRVWVAPSYVDGEQVVVDVAWEALCPISGFWSVFTHLVDPALENCVDNMHVLNQHDSMPDGGRKPFPAMAVDSVLVDQFRVAIPDGLPLADSAVHIGLYDAGGTFIRAFVADHAAGETIGAGVSVGECAPELIALEIATP